MTRIPFPALVVVAVALAATVAALIRPGRIDVLVGASLGTGMAGVFAAAAVTLMGRIRKRGGESAGAKMLNAFVGLMVVRMIGYLLLVLAAVFLGAGEPISVGIGLVVGTMVFQALEIVYLRNLT